MIRAVRERTPPNIWTFFDDLPRDDFKQLFPNPFLDAASFVLGSDVFRAVVGGSLNGRVVPESSHHVATVELPSGGKLLVQVFGRNEEYDPANGIVAGLSDVMLGMVEAGRIGSEIYKDFIFPVFYRSLAALLAPVAGGPEKAALRIDRVEALECSVPFNEEFSRTGDARVWAKGFAGFIWAFSEPVVTAPRRPRAARRDEAGQGRV